MSVLATVFGDGRPHGSAPCAARGQAHGSAPCAARGQAHGSGRLPARGQALPRHVRRLAITNFRSYAEAALDLDPRPVVITGPNGAGKTNLLEALSFLGPGQGIRRARLRDVARRNGNAEASWAVAARIAGGGANEVALGTGIEGPGRAAGWPAGSGPAPDGDDPRTAPDRRLVRIDGKAAPGPQALAAHLAITWVTPAMDRLFLEGAAGRRRFLDRLVYGFDPAHARRVSAYERALRERLRLLREGVRDAAWLLALEARMAEEGAAIAAARREVVGRLSLVLEAPSGPFPQALVSAEGTLEGWLSETAAIEVEDRYRAVLARGRGEDEAAGRTRIGPHRSDLAVWDAARLTRAEDCSTGEQKALLVTIVLAAARMRAAEDGSPPVLLLDEAMAHLDPSRRAALAEALLALGAQAWLTGTERGLFSAFGTHAQYWEAAESRLRPA